MYQFTQQGLHFKLSNLLLSLSPAIQPQNQNHKTSNRIPSTHQRQHASYGSTVAPSSPHNTHSQPNSAHTRTLQTSQSTFPHWSILIRASNASLATRTRHRDSISRFLSTHCLVFPLTIPHTLVKTKPLSLSPPSPPSTQPACGIVPFQFYLFLTTLRILCLCLSQPRASGGERMRPCGLSRFQGPLPLATILFALNSYAEHKTNVLFTTKQR